MTKIALGVALVGLGLIAGAFAPGVGSSIRALVELAVPARGAAAPTGGETAGHAHGAHGHAEGEHEGPEGHVAMTAQQVEAARIVVEPVAAGTLTSHLVAPGLVAPDGDRIARVAAKVIGTVAEMKKRLGDKVDKGEVVAILDSREVADARSEYHAALTNLDLQKTLFEREQMLWDKRVSAEQQYLRARNTFIETQLRVDLAAQKLLALGLTDEVDPQARRPIAARPPSASALAPISGLQRYALRSPIAGRVVERRVDLGAPVGGEGQEKELYVVADLSSVWIELSVQTGDLPLIREGQEVTVSAAGGTPAKGRIVFVSPMLNQETRSARVIASVENKGLAWRPGTYVTVQVMVEQAPVDLRVPRSALQTIGGEQVVFVRNEAGFEKRQVELGKTDDASVEIVFGLEPGDRVAVTNSFLLKAELGKAEAEHVH